MTSTEMFLITLDSDRAGYETVMAITESAIEEANEPCDQVRSGHWTRKQAQKFITSDAIKNYVEDLIDDAGCDYPDPKSCIVRQLVRNAFEDISWHDVADHYIAKVKENL